MNKPNFFICFSFLLQPSSLYILQSRPQQYDFPWVSSQQEWRLTEPLKQRDFGTAPHEPDFARATKASGSRL